MTSLSDISPQDGLIGGKYRLGPVIGAGGVATVYRATHLWTERQVALKLLNPSLPHFERLREGFLREARATVQLDHPNVVDVLDMGEDDWETAYLVMELLEGPTLRDVLLERGHLSEEHTLAILLPLIDALQKAHRLGIVHRDFKPENIMLVLDSYGVVTPKLLDFGVAEILQEARARSLSGGDDVIMGTPQYMSPERARDERTLIGPHTDVWGVGVVWYECLTGRAPFDGDSALEVLTAVCEAPIDFAGVPEAYVPLLRDALGRTTDRRIGTLSELKARIEQMGIAISSLPPAPSSLSSQPPRPDESEVRLSRSGWDAKKPALLPAPATTPSAPELQTIPLRSSRKAFLAGLALTIAIALSAWWSVAAPREEPAPERMPAVAEPEALAEIAEPITLPTELPEQIAAESSGAASAEPNEEVAAEPVPQAAKSAPRKPRRRSRPERREVPPASDGAEQQGPPDLVTQW